MLTDYYIKNQNEDPALYLQQHKKFLEQREINMSTRDSTIYNVENFQKLELSENDKNFLNEIGRGFPYFYFEQKKRSFSSNISKESIIENTYLNILELILPLDEYEKLLFMLSINSYYKFNSNHFEDFLMIYRNIKIKKLEQMNSLTNIDYPDVNYSQQKNHLNLKLNMILNYISLGDFRMFNDYIESAINNKKGELGLIPSTKNNVSSSELLEIKNAISTLEILLGHCKRINYDDRDISNETYFINLNFDPFLNTFKMFKGLISKHFPNISDLVFIVVELFSFDSSYSINQQYKSNYLNSRLTLFNKIVGDEKINLYYMIRYFLDKVSDVKNIKKVLMDFYLNSNNSELNAFSKIILYSYSDIIIDNSNNPNNRLPVWIKIMLTVFEDLINKDVHKNLENVLYSMLSSFSESNLSSIILYNNYSVAINDQNYSTVLKRKFFMNDLDKLVILLQEEYEKVYNLVSSITLEDNLKYISMLISSVLDLFKSEFKYLCEEFPIKKKTILNLCDCLFKFSYASELFSGKYNQMSSTAQILCILEASCIIFENEKKVLSQYSFLPYLYSILNNNLILPLLGLGISKEDQLNNINVIRNIFDQNLELSIIDSEYNFELPEVNNMNIDKNTYSYSLFSLIDFLNLKKYEQYYHRLKGSPGSNNIDYSKLVLKSLYQIFKIQYFEGKKVTIVPYLMFPIVSKFIINLVQKDIFTFNLEQKTFIYQTIQKNLIDESYSSLAINYELLDLFVFPKNFLTGSINVDEFTMESFHKNSKSISNKLFQEAINNISSTLFELSFIGFQVKENEVL